MLPGRRTRWRWISGRLGWIGRWTPARPVVPRGRHRGNHAGGFCLGTAGFCAGGAGSCIRARWKKPSSPGSWPLPASWCWAIAPIVLVILGSLGLEGLAPGRAVIAMYPSFFPVAGHGAGPALAPGDRNRNDVIPTRPVSWQVLWLLACHCSAIPVSGVAWVLLRAWWCLWWPSCPPVPRRGWARACSRVRLWANTLGIWSCVR